MTSATTKRPATYSREMLQWQIRMFTGQLCPDSECWRDLRLPPPDTTMGGEPAWKRKTVDALFLRWERQAKRRASILRINPETLALEIVKASHEKRDDSRRAAWVYRVHGVEVKP